MEEETDFFFLKIIKDIIPEKILLIIALTFQITFMLSIKVMLNSGTQTVTASVSPRIA